jgi:CheY-like chemotaxis protein
VKIQIGKITKSVLLIEDQAIARQTMRQQLEYYGYKVLEATTGKEGLQLFNQNKADVGIVLLDLTLPDVSVEQMLAALRTLDADVRVAVCTDDSLTESKSKEEFKDLVGILKRPVRTDRLLAVLRKGLEG